MKHDLKTQPQYFDDVLEGRKTFEIRFNDRDFKVGDQVVLREFDPIKNDCTGRLIHAELAFIWGRRSKYVMLWFTNIKEVSLKPKWLMNDIIFIAVCVFIVAACIVAACDLITGG